MRRTWASFIDRGRAGSLNWLGEAISFSVVRTEADKIAVFVEIQNVGFPPFVLTVTRTITVLNHNRRDLDLNPSHPPRDKRLSISRFVPVQKNPNRIPNFDGSRGK